MPVIFYGLAGEGLGHTFRTLSVIEHLPADYQVHIFTWGEAYDFFAQINYPFLYKTTGIHFGRDKNNEIDYRICLENCIKFQHELDPAINYVVTEAHKHKPVLFISDFDRVIAKAAQRYGKPFLSIDNQHKFSRCVIDKLPWRLYFYSFVMGVYTEWTCPRPDHAVVSTFYHSDVKCKYARKTTLTNCFMRKSIENTPVTKGDFLLLYYKTSVGPRMLHEISKCHEKTVVFNCPLNRQIKLPYLEYKDIDSEGFVKMLASCRAVFGSAGNQLLGEAIYFNKPLFAVPEPNQPEQEINAYYLATKGYGDTCKIKKFTTARAMAFINNFEPIKKQHVNGVYEAMRQIERFSKQ